MAEPTAKKKIPEEVSNRFSLDSLLKKDRGTIRSQMREVMPKLIEKALENPSGTFQMVTNEQSAILNRIDLNIIELKEILGELGTSLSKNKGKGEEEAAVDGIIPRYLRERRLGASRGSALKKSVRDQIVHGNDAEVGKRKGKNKRSIAKPKAKSPKVTKPQPKATPKATNVLGSKSKVPVGRKILGAASKIPVGPMLKTGGSALMSGLGMLGSLGSATMSGLGALGSATMSGLGTLGSATMSGLSSAGSFLGQLGSSALSTVAPQGIGAAASAAAAPAAVLAGGAALTYGATEMAKGEQGKQMAELIQKDTKEQGFSMLGAMDPDAAMGYNILHPEQTEADRQKLIQKQTEEQEKLKDAPWYTRLYGIGKEDYLKNVETKQNDQNDYYAAAKELRLKRMDQEKSRDQSEASASLKGMATETGNILQSGVDGATKNDDLINRYNALVKSGKVPQKFIDDLKPLMGVNGGKVNQTMANKMISTAEQTYLQGTNSANIDVTATEKGVTVNSNLADLPAQNAKPMSGTMAAELMPFNVDQNRSVPERVNPEESNMTILSNMIDERMAAIQSALGQNQPSILQPGGSATPAPRFESPAIPTSLGIVAMRSQGLADVYPHPLSGPTMQNSDRGGENLFQ